MAKENAEAKEKKAPKRKTKMVDKPMVTITSPEFGIEAMNEAVNSGDEHSRAALEGHASWFNHNGHAPEAFNESTCTVTKINTIADADKAFEAMGTNDGAEKLLISDGKVLMKSIPGRGNSTKNIDVHPAIAETEHKGATGFRNLVNFNIVPGKTVLVSYKLELVAPAKIKVDAETGEPVAETAEAEVPQTEAAEA